MVVLLKEDVAGSKRKLELQAVNIGRGFKSVLQMKNEELDKLKNKNMELQKKVTVLEDQLAERDVHDVTQAFQVVEVGRNSEGVSEEGFGRGSVVICDVSPLRVVGQRGDKVDAASVDDVQEFIPKMVDGESDVKISYHAIDVVANVVEGVEAVGMQNSFVRNIKNKEDITNGVVVYFTGVKNLIRQSCICGNVIDAYTEVLKTEQLRMYGNDELANKSYFFNSMCLDMVKNNDVRVMEKYVRRNVLAGSEFRYIHFPMCHLAHWTLVVYDTEDGSWKNFNPMRQCGDRTNVHYSEAVILPLEFVTNCPQQKPETLDCGVIVCAVMRQFVYRCDMERSLQGTNCSVLRANMVKALINDTLRGVKE
ncbi:hypothetical protein LOK49_Contig50G00001 [Camellia lanceoleosa]|nr:hypothetical protein LOK49_Contig50G00001 [Camellia lanceoleosa]